MTAAILSLVAYLLPLIVQGLQAWSTQRKGGNNEANVQTYRKALVKNDTAALGVQHADQHDRVLAALRGRQR